MTRFLLWLYRLVTRALERRAVVMRDTLPSWRDGIPDDPNTFPPTPHGERFVVWSRGGVDTITNDGREATNAWARVTKRAGVHRFWDREHRTGVPHGLRTELCIPLSE